MAALEAWWAVEAFFERGGDVLFAILAVTLVMWTLLFERYWFLWRIYPKRVDATVRAWNQRADRHSWRARQIRRAWVSELSRELGRGLATVKTLVALCPLLGLLGTVTGMVEVFDVMAMLGSGNPRAMASGVSKATIPTMAGMVAALSGLYFSGQLERRAREESRRLADRLT